MSLALTQLFLCLRLAALLSPYQWLFRCWLAAPGATPAGVVANIEFTAVAFWGPPHVM